MVCKNSAAECLPGNWRRPLEEDSIIPERPIMIADCAMFRHSDRACLGQLKPFGVSPP